MKIVCALFTAIVLFACVACADNSLIVGAWDISAADTAGHESIWVLTVKEDGAALTGSMRGVTHPEIELAIAEAKLDGNRFTFKATLNGQPYVFETKVSGKELEGKFDGPEASGTLKGTRK